MSEELEVDYVEQESTEMPEEEAQWSHEVLMQFELVKGTNRLSVSHLKKGAYLITTNKPNSNKQLFVKN